MDRILAYKDRKEAFQMGELACMKAASTQAWRTMCAVIVEAESIGKEN